MQSDHMLLVLVGELLNQQQGNPSPVRVYNNAEGVEIACVNNVQAHPQFSEVGLAFYQPTKAWGRKVV